MAHVIYVFDRYLTVIAKILYASKLMATCGELVDMKQYSRIVADSICDLRILSEIRGYFS